MKVFFRKYLLPLITLLTCCIGAIPSHGETFRIAELQLSLNGEWGRPVLNQYDEAARTGDWRFIRQAATLIVTRAECATCKEITQADVDALNKQKSRATSAILLNHKGFPAMLRLSASPNGENLRVFQMQANGFRYEVQMGVDIAASQEQSFQLEMEFMQMINAWNPEPVRSHLPEPARPGK